MGKTFKTILNVYMEINHIYTTYKLCDFAKWLTISAPVFLSVKWACDIIIVSDKYNPVSFYFGNVKKYY